MIAPGNPPRSRGGGSQTGDAGYSEYTPGDADRLTVGTVDIILTLMRIDNASGDEDAQTTLLIEQTDPDQDGVV